ncbi:alpha/beta hydrolase [Gemmatimonas sp.]|uniref:alpha/beta hydrolase n=1 Tax=Gemmatimonas sp. TaxID=1962908 RepID=UPI003982D8E3
MIALALLAVGAALGVGLGTGAPTLARLARFETKAIEGMPIVGNKAAFRLFEMPDSVAVYGTQYFLPSRGTIILLHGLGAHDALAIQAGDSLRRVTGMNILFLDLRGNGRSGGARGRIGHDAQYANDLTGVVRELKRANPSGPVLLVGVRQGAGTVLAFAERGRDRDQPRVQGIALVDPILTRDSLQAAGTQDGGAFQWHTRRLATQQLLNVVGLHFADRLPVAYQRAQRPDGPTARTFSWRAIRTLLPSDPWAIANDVPLPVLLFTRQSPATAPLRRTDLHEIEFVRADASLFTSSTWRIFERWTAQFSADAAIPENILPYVPIPLADTTR